MGEVYRAEDTRLGRAVALKFLRHGHDDPDERARLLREARAASSLSSSNIAAIYDLGEHETRPFIVMELVEGEPLSARIARGPLPVAEAVASRAGRRRARRSARARHHPPRHQEREPDGRRPRGRVKLLDFGLAQIVEQRRRRRHDAAPASLETVAGTVHGDVRLHVAGAGARPAARRAARTCSRSASCSTRCSPAGCRSTGATVTEIADRILNHEPAGARALQLQRAAGARGASC